MPTIDPNLLALSAHLYLGSLLYTIYYLLGGTSKSQKCKNWEENDDKDKIYISIEMKELKVQNGEIVEPPLDYLVNIPKNNPIDFILTSSGKIILRKNEATMNWNFYKTISNFLLFDSASFNKVKKDERGAFTVSMPTIYGNCDIESLTQQTGWSTYVVEQFFDPTTCTNFNDFSFSDTTDDGYSTLNIFYNLIPLTGSEASVLFIVKKLTFDGGISSIDMALKMLTKLAGSIRNPTFKVLEALKEVAESKSSAAVLAYTAAVGTAYERNASPELLKYIQQVENEMFSVILIHLTIKSIDMALKMLTKLAGSIRNPTFKVLEALKEVAESKSSAAVLAYTAAVGTAYERNASPELLKYIQQVENEMFSGRT
uniref:Vitellogenin domain-containing protein n=1 Tax=Lutzomyia longipalpis TaxID=7200 RepID=A0A1B0CUX3_LUTLO